MPGAGTEHRKLAAIMFTDMVGYSALAQRVEPLALELLEQHRRIVRGILPTHGGREVKSIGDGFLIELPSALAAVQCAVAIQEALHERNQKASPERQVRIRIGIHVGDVVVSEGDIHGDGVNIAARLEPLAKPGGICISSAVCEQVRNKISHRLAVLDSVELKNIELPVVVHRVVMPWERALPTAPAPGHRRAGLVAAAALAAAVLAAGGWWLFQRLGSSRSVLPATNALPSSVANANALGQKSVAVIPFVNISTVKADEYLGDGMTEELLNVLGKLKELRVPGRSSCFAFKGKTEEGIFRKVGEQLHVNTVLEGSVRKAGDKLRVTAQLINLADGFHLWSETYDRDMTNIFAIQSDIALRVAEALKTQLGVEETRMLTKKPTENPEAYRLYLLGRYHFARATAAGWTNGIHYYNEARGLDPNFALAYCGLADSYGWMAGYAMPGKQGVAQQRALSQKALELAPDLPEAHCSVGMSLVGRFDWQGAEREIKRALELNPGSVLARDACSYVLMCLGRFDEAIVEQKKAVELDPLSTVVNSDLAWRLLAARRYDEALDQLHKTLELDSNSFQAHFTLAWTLLWKGDTASAIAMFQKARALDDQPWVDSSLGYAYAVSGDRAKAEQILQDLEETAKRKYVAAGNRVNLYLGLGRKDKALEWLERGYEDMDVLLLELKATQSMDSIRNEPRFQALLKKVGLDK